MSSIGSLFSSPLGGALFQTKGLLGMAKDATKSDDQAPPPPAPIAPPRVTKPTEALARAARTPTILGAGRRAEGSNYG